MANNEPRQFTIVIFGASGDLTQRKLAPALFHLHSIGALPKRCRFVAVARSDYDDETYRKLLFETASDSYSSDAQHWIEFAKQISYVRGSSNDVESLKRLDDFIRADSDGETKDDRLYYLALSPHSLRKHRGRLRRRRHARRNLWSPAIGSRKTLRH